METTSPVVVCRQSQDVQQNRPAPMGVTEAGGDPETNSAPIPDIESGFPAWLCVMGAFFFILPSFGLMLSIGTFQSYLHLNQLKDYSAGDVGWISGMYMFLGLLLSIQVGPFLDHFGPRLLGWVGAAMTVTMFFLVAECKLYWHFMLCFGIFGGLGSAINGLIGVAVVGKLFSRHRGLALGVAMTGGSVGSIIFPIVLRDILPRYGWQWSMRIIGFFFAGMMLLGIACILPYPRLLRSISPGGQLQPRRDTAALNFAAFRSPAFGFVTAGMFTFEFTIFAIGGLLPTIATEAGFTPEDGYVLLAIIGALACPGRILPGLLGDRVGHYNVILAMVVVTMIFMGTLFVPFTLNMRVLYAFSALWGFCTGSFLSLTPVCVGKTCEAKDYGRYYGTMNFFISFALLLAIPVSGIMIENMGAQALAGLLIAIIFLGGGCFFAARALLIGEWFSFKTII